MARTVKCYFTNSLDIKNYEPGVSEVYLLNTDITLDVQGDEMVFRIMNEPVSDEQECIHIDLGTSKGCEVMIPEDFDVTEITAEWLETASFLDFVRKTSNLREEL